MRRDSSLRAGQLGVAWRIAPVVLFLSYVVFASALAVRQHDSFHTHAFDMAYFDNVVWNTSQGRPFVNDLPDKPEIFLADHFSPALIAVALLYRLWSDPRMLLIAQALALALSVVPCYLLVRERHPRLAVFTLLALYLNPALLGVALSEFHEIALAAPLMAFALWLLARRTTDDGPRTADVARLRHSPSVFALLLAALVVKEELAIVVAAVGVYMLVVKPHAVRAGMLLIVVAVAWLVFVWGILPSMLPDAISHWQDRYGDIAPTPTQGIVRLLTDPLLLVSRYLSAPKIIAVARVLLPLAFLPVLAPSLFAVALPVFAYLLLSDKQSVSQLQAWYVAPLLPILFVATSMAIASAPRQLARAMTVALLLLGGLSYWLWSVGPFAREFAPMRFDVSARRACAQRVLALVPPNASISAQDNLLPHLAHRRALNVFPSLGEPTAEYVVLDGRVDLSDGHNNWTPFRPLEVPHALNQFLARPDYILIGDACDYKLLRYTDEPVIAHMRDQLFSQTIHLLGYEIADADAEGAYQPTERAWGARALRVTLWWKAGTPLVTNYTVFVHALAANGTLVGQHDSPPANGFMPTTQWEVGEIVKDIHYLASEANVSRIEVGLYDARSGERLKLEDGSDALRVTP